MEVGKMKKFKVILALIMVFVLLASVNVFAASNGKDLSLGFGHISFFNNMTDTQISAQTTAIIWSTPFMPGGYASVSVVYNGTTLASQSLYIATTYTNASVNVARPSETIIPSQSYTYHEVYGNYGSWSTQLPLN
jgi:uncharacterized membrane protein